MEPLDPQDVTDVLVEASTGNLEEVQRLVEQDGRLATASDSTDFSALHGAAKQGHLAVARYLLDKGAVVDQGTYKGLRPIDLAAFHDHLEVVLLLLGRGSDIHACDHEGDTALIAAAWPSRVRVVEALLAHGADIDHRGKDGSTALWWAACHNNLPQQRGPGALPAGGGGGRHGPGRVGLHAFGQGEGEGQSRVCGFVGCECRVAMLQ
jgi:ankyrin repeat protein